MLVASVTSNVGASSLVFTAFSGAFYRLNLCRNLRMFRYWGGCYFIPAMHSAFTDQIQIFLGKLNGQLLRFPVPAGTSEGDRSVKEAVACGLSAMIEEHRAAVACFGEDTRESTLERAAERIRVTRHKLSAYSEYLSGERDRLEKELTLASSELRAKVESLAASREDAPSGGAASPAPNP